jgi:GSCFA family
MQFQLPIQLISPEKKIAYKDKILLVGSCFTEHIGNSLKDLKFSVLQNPNGILFNPMSVCKSLESYIQNKQYEESELFYLNEVWNSWEHHSCFSHLDKKECLKGINESQRKAHSFLKEADWLIITLGSSFCYRLTEDSSQIQKFVDGEAVANCHRAPAQWFEKFLLSIEEIVTDLENCCDQLLQFNSTLKIIFTISPVRHVRDGVVENNRSKARLLESVHHLVNNFENIHYFPAYELVIDVLRDYRFYDIDLIHPNYMATEFVLEKFTESYIEPDSVRLMEEVKKIVIARKHKAFQPATHAHKAFLKIHLEKANELQKRFPYIDLSEEIDYFGKL